MDNQEAIRLIRNLLTMCIFTDAYGEPIDSNAYYEAVDMAISALQEQNSKTRRICDTCKHNPPSKKLPCVDCDMRDPADRWEPKDVPDTNVGDIYMCSCGYGWDKSKVFRHHFCPNCGRAVEPSYNLTKTELNGDMVSRQNAIDAAMEYGKKVPTYAIRVKNAIEQLPSAQPKIIRCKECINHGKEICYFWSHFYGTINTPDDGFCYKAERRTDEQTD